LITESSTKKGKAVEYFLIHELLKHDFDVYTPVTDVEGVDMIIRNKEGVYIELQVKSRTIKDARNEFKIKDFKKSQNFFIVCHNLSDKNEFYVLPSYVYDREAETKIENGKKIKLLRYYSLSKYSYYKNEQGIELLKKALKNPNNQISSFQKPKT